VLNAKLLFLDIETSLMLVYSFGLRDQHLTHNQIADDRDAKLIHCIGMKWRGKPVQVFSEWEHGYQGMMQATHDALCEADAVVTYNGARFDIPKINGQFLLLGMEPPPPVTQIDLFKTARKMGLPSGKLDYLSQRLGIGQKVKHDGFKLWVDVFNGCTKAQAKMAQYCAGDVRLTERVYNKLRPHISSHPHLAEAKRSDCGACGSSRLQARGFARSKATIAQRYQCQACGSWSLGPRSKVA
jgi:DNA polymerase elongation subunit (family B)